MTHSAPGSPGERQPSRQVAIARTTAPAVTRSRVDSRPASRLPSRIPSRIPSRVPSRAPSRAPTGATIEEIPEPIVAPSPSTNTRAAAVGDAAIVGTNAGTTDGLLHATAVRAICVAVSGLSELMDRLSRLEKARSVENDTALSKKEKSKKRDKKSRKSRRKRRKDEDDSSSSSSSDSSSSEESDSDTERRRRHRRKKDRGVKTFREKGDKHPDLRPIKATNPLYAELLNHRHYRLEKTTRRRNKDTTKARQQVKNMGLTMLPHLFTGEDPIMILDFLRRFVGEAEQLAMSEEQAYVALPFFLKAQAKHHFEAVKDTTSEGEGGVTCWPEAVQYLLHSYATANAIRAATLALRDVRQQAGEGEQVYSARLAKAEIRCGNIHTQDEKKTLFIDGLSPAIKAIVSRHRETHDEETYLELLQHAQAEGDTYRARAREGRKPTSTSLAAAARTPGPSKPAPRKASHDHALIADPFAGLRDPLAYASQQRDDQDALMFMGDRESDMLTSIPTTDLPSTVVDEVGGQEDPLLAFNQRDRGGSSRYNTPAPRIPYQTGTKAAAQRPGWDRTRSPNRPQGARVICHTCYDLDNPHYAPDCCATFRDLSRIVRNYECLSPEQKARVPKVSYLRASARFTPDGRVVTPASAQPEGRRTPPAVERHPSVLRRPHGEGPSAKN